MNTIDSIRFLRNSNKLFLESRDLAPPRATFNCFCQENSTPLHIFPRILSLARQHQLRRYAKTDKLAPGEICLEKSIRKSEFVFSLSLKLITKQRQINMRLIRFLNFIFVNLREQSFLIPGTRAEDFWQGYETFFHHFVWVRKF